MTGDREGMPAVGRPASNAPARLAVVEDAPQAVRAALNGHAPTLEQWEAITAPLAPMCLVAGAGSGKTAVMAARMVWLVSEGVARPEDVLGLTFTNKAAEELAGRVGKALEPLGLRSEGVRVDTYHAFTATLVRDLGVRIGIEANVGLLSEAQRWQLVLRILADEILLELPVRSLGRVVRDVLDLADRCADHLVEPEDVAAYDRGLLEEAGGGLPRDVARAAAERAEICRIVRRYIEEKRRRSRIDFGDQIAKAVELAGSFPEVAKALRERYPVVLLDEYQDTNVAQRVFLQQVWRGCPVTAVGDTRQAIYGFRGATLHNLLEFPSQFAVEGVEVARRDLAANFRSGRRILALANTVIEKVPLERRSGPELIEHPANGEGWVRAFLAGDNEEEAEAIADQIKELHQAGLPDGGPLDWSDLAVLCRSRRRFFGPLAEAFRARDIPFEVTGFGGLLSVPEVVDAVAYLRLLNDPGRNVYLARLLLGPRWRISYRDLARLARWAAGRTTALRQQVDEEDPDLSNVRFPMAEALDHLDEVGELSEPALQRLERFASELKALRANTSMPLLDLVREILETTGIWRELAASRHRGAQAARQNLLNFLDAVASFSPLEGTAGLPAFLAYLDAAEAVAEDPEAAQPSVADSVKLMTVHQAKGLEWKVVFLPGLAGGQRSEGRKASPGIFPDVRLSNPMTSRGALPHAVREDHEHLPRWEGKAGEFEKSLRERAEEEERRLFYVAVTRARRMLVCSAAQWYDETTTPKGPSIFFSEVAEHSVTERLGPWVEQPPDPNPIFAKRADRASKWPPEPHVLPLADPLFAEGHVEAALEAMSGLGAVERRAAGLPAPDRERFDAAVGRAGKQIALLEACARAQEIPSRAIPKALSVSQVADYARCPRVFYFTAVRPLPRRFSEAARRGTEIHRWIELRGRGQLVLIDEEADLVRGTRGDVGQTEKLKSAFQASRFAELAPLYVELPFTLLVGGMLVRGRVDAVYAGADGRWELVDFKTGKVPGEGEPADLQLNVYALAAAEVWNKPAEDLTLTYCYLGAGVERSRQMRPEGLRAAREDLEGYLARVAEGEFPPHPTPSCARCDFLAFCPEGRDSL